MSLYLGSKDNGRPIMHLTSGNEQAAQLKGDPIKNSTLFHSDFPYVGVLKTLKVTRARYKPSPYRGQTLYQFDPDEATIQEIEKYTNQGYLISVSRMVPAGAYRGGRSYYYYDIGQVGRDPFAMATGTSIPGTPDIAINNVTGALNNGGGQPNWGSYPGRFAGQSASRAAIQGTIGKLGDQSIVLSGLGRTFNAQGRETTRGIYSFAGSGGMVESRRLINTNSVAMSTPNFATSGNRLTTATLKDVTSFRSYMQQRGELLYTTWGVHFSQHVTTAPQYLYWSPDGSGNPSVPAHSLLKRGGILFVSILNIRVDPTTGVLTHEKPLDKESKIHIDRDNLEVGDLQLKTTSIITHIKGANLAKNTNIHIGRLPDGKEVINKYTSKAEFDYYDAVASRSLAELAEAPVMGVKLYIPAPNNPGGSIITPFDGGGGSWRWLIRERHFNVMDPRHVLGTNIQVEVNENSIKYRNPYGKQFVVADRNSKFAAFRLGGKDALSATFPAQRVNFNQLRQGSSFRATYPSIISASPNPVGTWIKRVGMGSVTLPQPVSSAGSIIAYVSPGALNGQVCGVDMFGKLNRCTITTGINSKLNKFKCVVFDKARGNQRFQVARFSLSAGYNLSFGGSGGWLPDNGSTNRWQGVIATYYIQANFPNNSIDMYAEYALENQHARYIAWSDARTTWISQYNKLGETDVTYHIPEISLGIYPLFTT